MTLRQLGTASAVLLGAAIATAAAAGTASAAGGIHKIKHVVIIMQENRSFDNYFGTFPGANGLPKKHGKFTTCVPDPKRGGCVKPYHDPNFVDMGGPHDQGAYTADLDNGHLDGFVKERENCYLALDPMCNGKLGNLDEMGYHDQP